MADVHVSSLHVYPVKGCRGIDVTTAVVEPWGLEGDRRWLVIDEAGRFQSQREQRSLARVTVRLVDEGIELTADGMERLAIKEPHGGPLVPVNVWKFHFEAMLADRDGSAWFSEYLGGSYRLVWLDDPLRRPLREPAGIPATFADGYPILATNEKSLDMLNDWLVEKGEEPVPMTRFRPNVVVGGTSAAWAEDDWFELVAPDVTLWAAKPCGRCVVTTIDQVTGTRPSREPLFTLAQRRRLEKDPVFGQNLAPRAPGRIRVGDALALVSA